MRSATELIADGRKARIENRLVEARSLYAEAAQLYRDENNTLAYAHTIRHIADMYLDESRLRDAQPLYEEALKLYRSNLHTKVLDLANTVRPYALVNEGLDKFKVATQFWQEARNLYASLGLEVGIKECETHLERLQHN